MKHYTSKLKRPARKPITKKTYITRKDNTVGVANTSSASNPIKDEASKRIAAGDQTPYDLLVLTIALETLEEEYGANNTTLEWRDNKDVKARITSCQ